MSKVKVARKPFLQTIRELWEIHKEYRSWSKIDAYTDRLTRKEKKLQYLRAKGAAMEAKAGMLNGEEGAKETIAAQKLIDFYQSEIDFNSCTSHASTTTRIVGIAALIAVEIALWFLMLYLPFVNIMPDALQIVYTVATLLIIAVGCDLLAFRLFGKFAEALLKHRNRKLKEYISTISWNT